MHRCVLVLLVQSLKVKHTQNREKRMAKMKSEAFHERMLKKRCDIFLSVPVPVLSWKKDDTVRRKSTASSCTACR